MCGWQSISSKFKSGNDLSATEVQYTEQDHVLFALIFGENTVRDPGLVLGWCACCESSLLLYDGDQQHR